MWEINDFGGGGGGYFYFLIKCLMKKYNPVANPPIPAAPSRTPPPMVRHRVTLLKLKEEIVGSWKCEWECWWGPIRSH